MLLLLISLFLLNSNDNRQIQAIRSYTVGLIGVVQNIFTVVPNIFEIQHENEVLRQLNVKLSDEVNRLRSARIENLRLREMLSLKEKSSTPLVTADVVAKSLHLMRNTVTLNVGKNNGVMTNMPIISVSGLVGRIVASSDNYSIGQILFNKDFRVSAKIQRSRVDGIIRWNGGEVVNLINIAKTQDVRVGDVVETSEYSHHFPAHITIGVVVNIKEKQGSLFFEIEVKPVVEFSSLEQVFVMLYTPDTERLALEEKFFENK